MLIYFLNYSFLSMFNLMNKLLNLLIIFIALKYVLPLTIKNIHQIPQSIFSVNLATAGGIFLIQFIYNYFMKTSNLKKVTFRDNVYNSLFRALVVFAAYYIYEDVKAHYNINIPGIEDDATIRSLFIVVILTFFILTKCLITP